MRGLICDDHPLMRAALVSAMRGRWPHLELDEAGDYPSAWALAQRGPDFCLVDLSMPGSEPLEGLATLRARAPKATLVVNTGVDDAGLLEAVRNFGVAAICFKNAEPATLIETIRARVQGIRALELKALPPRQLQVLRLMAEGMSNKQIAQKLTISPSTVKIHVARLTEELGAINRTDAVARAKSAWIL
uniref:response regulator transcription factor n=1 Tax=uncultured Caulobacter sp. TaxID=158749 RepID=UPI0025FA1EA8|nr:response regulator transcription factor [uncultured Caulobacter sp.]